MSQQQTQNDPVANFIASYLSWASKHHVHSVSVPLISFRGHDRNDWSLLASLCRHKSRNGKTMPVEVLKQWEDDIIEQFRNRFQLDLPDWQDLDVLAYAQHHGAPTRLLDWSRNPFIGLWFAVSDRNCNSRDGVVFQLLIPSDGAICLSENSPLKHMDECAKSIHVFSSPHRIDRTERQRSVFSIATFNDEVALKPLNEVAGHEQFLRSFSVPAQMKGDIRRLLSLLALDANSVYGDADSFGKALGLRLDISDFDLMDPTPPASGAKP